MPAYPWLEQTDLDIGHIADDLSVQADLGVPYTAEMIENAVADAITQASAEPERRGRAPSARYPKANIRAFTSTGQTIGRPTEADALIAYLQSLGTAVDFKLYDDKANIR